MGGRTWRELQALRMHAIKHPEDLPQNAALLECLVVSERGKAESEPEVAGRPRLFTAAHIPRW
jgi:hypothetical protein